MAKKRANGEWDVCERRRWRMTRAIRSDSRAAGGPAAKQARERQCGNRKHPQKNSSRWEGRYTQGIDPITGRAIQKSVSAKTQAEVKTNLTKAIENSRALDISRADEYTVAAWLRAWFELYAEPHARPSTADCYRRSIKLHVAPAIGGVPLSKLTTRDLQKFYKDLQEHSRVDRIKAFCAENRKFAARCATRPKVH